jgi:hypothetical protein
MKILLTKWLAFWVSLAWQFNSSLEDNYWNIPLLVTSSPYLDLASSKNKLTPEMVFISALDVFFLAGCSILDGCAISV